MKLLFVVPYAPSQVRVRPYGFLRALARRGHQITLLTLRERPDEDAALATLRALGITCEAWPLDRARKLGNCLRALPTRAPVQAHFSRHPGLTGRLRDLLTAADRFDAVHVEHLRGSAYALAARDAVRSARLDTRVVWDSVDSITHLFEQSARHSSSLGKRLLTALDLARTRRYEGWLACQFDRTLVTSGIDRAVLLKLADGACVPMDVIPNGVDLEAFAPAHAPRDAGTLIFTGKLSYHANITAVTHFVRAVLPAVLERHPETVLRIVGKDPAPEILALAARQPRNIVVTGSVPDLAEHLRKAEIAVAPIVYGAGVQNKVLEAMATATPVVVSHTAVASLDASVHQAACVAHSDVEFAAHVNRLLDDEAAREQLAQAGRAFVERHHSWDDAAQRLETAYAGA
jgi:polysaccharide biosynthesis protein PslH